jgi:hypothetical protein
MKKHALLSVAALVLVVLSMTSCSKNALDYDLNQTDFKNRDFKRGNVDFQHADYVFDGCRIRQTVRHPESAWPYVQRFEYDKDNNPVSVTSDQPGTGYPNLYFKYDKKGNLIEYVGLYSGGNSFEFLHRYGYSDNRIVADTVYIFGQYPNPTSYYTKRVLHLKYDKFNRVIKDSVVYASANAYDQDIAYNYDNNGNLIRSGTTYDDKVSPQRTNKVWMFADRNYSVNNMVAANSYNSSGLPLTFSGNQFQTLAIFANTYFYGSAEITYDCIEHGRKFHPLGK